MAAVEVFVCPGCVTREELINQLLTGIPMEICGAKILISMPQLDDQYSGLLCSSDQLEVQNGTAKLNSSVFTLPLFHIHIPNTLSISGKIFCRSLTLGLPAEVVRVKNPLDLVKEIVLTRVKTNILQQQGLRVNEARRNGEFLRSVETSTLYDEVVESYGCPIEDAKKYVADFIELAEKPLSDSDISVDVLSAVIEKNTNLMSKCKDILSKEWSAENAEQLHAAQQTLDEVSRATEQQSQNAVALKTKQSDLQRQIEALQSKIDEREALANAVEENVAQRIAAARQNAADFISDLAFITPVATQNTDTSGPVPSIFDRPVKATEISSTIAKLSDFRRRLAENLEYSGYSEGYSAQLSQTLSFCVSQHLPVVCDSNAEIIADCLAAMFGLSGVRVIQISAAGCCSGNLVDLLRQKSANAPHVYLINGALDAYSPNIFNAILQDTYNLDSSILIFSSEGIPTEDLPSSVWSRAMFVDRDAGFIRFPQNSLKAYETVSNLRPELKADKLKEKREQLEPFSVVLSNRALLNYANFMATMDSSIQSDTGILTQIILSTKSDGRLEKLLELFEENGIETEDARFSKYL